MDGTEIKECSRGTADTDAENHASDVGLLSTENFSKVLESPASSSTSASSSLSSCVSIVTEMMNRLMLPTCKKEVLLVVNH